MVYRRQKDAERAQFARRFGAASAQLGDSDVAVRVAGVYAMAAAADESPAFARRQQCIDVLCGYLRLPYDPDSGENNLTEFVSTTTWAAQPPATHIEELRRQQIRQNDREVRSTILRVLARHVKAKAETSWSGNDFDFSGVLFESAAFEGAKFKCLRASFDSPAEWNDVEFDWDTSNVAGDSLPTIPRCITPRPWPPELAGEE